MKTYQPNQIRNVVFLGHQGSGKTTATESLLYVTTVTSKKGSIDEGNTVSDYSKEEKNQKISIYNSLIPIEYDDHKFNLIDTPGFFDFQQEVVSAMRVSRTAVLFIDATKGVEVGTIKAWRMLRAKSIPSILFINKMDKENINYDKIIEDIRVKLDKRAVPFCWPIGHGEEFKGFVNVVEMKARLYNGVTCEDAEIWPEKKEYVDKLHELIIESVANIDDKVLEKLMAGENIQLDEVRHGLKDGIQKGSLVPIIVGSVNKDIGVHTLLNTLRDYFPSDNDVRVHFGEATEQLEVLERKVDINEPFSALVFKTVMDPFIGKISYILVKSGKVSKDHTILNVNRQEKEKINNISFIRGKEMIETDTITAGDIGVLIKVASLETGDTIADPNKPIKYSDIERIEPTFYVAADVKNKNDEGKITESLRKVCQEDLSVTVNRNAEVKQLLVGCQGQLHIDTILHKIKNIYNIDVVLSPAKISYRETIKGRADVEGRYVKQSGGSGQYGIVNIKFEPSEKEFDFVDEIFGGAVPSNFVPAVEKGLVDSMKVGVLAGFPVIGVKATLHDGKYHPVDSSELAFKMAASFAFKDGCKQAKPTILEPIMEVTVIAPNDYVGDIMGDMSKRRGLIMGVEPVGDEQYITAECPQSELTSYIVDLKTMTQGQATFKMKFARYEEVPTHLAEKVIKENRLTEENGRA
jgi:elongation factor G